MMATLLAIPLPDLYSITNIYRECYQALRIYDDYYKHPKLGKKNICHIGFHTVNAIPHTYLNYIYIYIYIE